MDFKVAGSKVGMTGLQMGVKVPNVTIGIVREALAQAKRARLFILDKMVGILSSHARKCRGMLRALHGHPHNRQDR